MSQKIGGSGFWVWVVMALVWLGAAKGCSAINNEWGLKDWYQIHISCEYKNVVGDCLTEEAHMKIVAHDAAIDAITDTLQFCAGSYIGNQFDPRCVALKQVISQAH